MSKVVNCSNSIPLGLIALLIISCDDFLVKISSQKAHGGKAASLISSLGQSLDRG